MEKLLTTLGIIAWIAYSLYKAQKKQAKKPGPIRPVPPMDTVKSKAPDFMSFLDHALQREVSVERPQPIETLASKPINPVSRNISNKPVESWSYENTSNLPKTDIHTEEIVLSPENQAVGEALNLDIRKAFIYQTILHAPYQTPY